MSTSLTVGRPWRVLLVFVIPLFAGNVVQQLYQLTDAMVVGRVLGVTALASVGATASFLFLLLGFAWGMTSGFAIPTAQAFGAGDARAVRRSVAAGAILTGAVSLLVTVAAPLLTEPALRLLRTPEELVPQATTFATVSFLGTGATMYFNYLAAILRAIGDSRTPLLFLLVTCVVNIALVLLAVPGLSLGVGGAAAATVLAQAVSVLLCLRHLRRRVPVLRVRREDWHVTPAELGRHLHLGIPMGFQASIIALGMIAVQVRLNSLGADAVAAFTTAVRVDNFAMALFTSLGIAVSMYAAQNLGARRPDRIRTGVLQALWMTMAGAAVVGAVVALAGSSLVRLFVGPGEDHVVGMASYFLLVNGSLYVVLGALFVLRGALQGLGYTAVPTVTGLLELCCRIGAAVVLGAWWGFEGVVWGNPLAWFAAMTVLVPVYARAHRGLGRPGGSPISPAAPDLAVVGPPGDGAAVVEAAVVEAAGEDTAAGDTTRAPDRSSRAAVSD